MALTVTESKALFEDKADWIAAAFFFSAGVGSETVLLDPFPLSESVLLPAESFAELKISSTIPCILETRVCGSLYLRDCKVKNRQCKGTYSSTEAALKYNFSSILLQTSDNDVSQALTASLRFSKIRCLMHCFINSLILVWLMECQLTAPAVKSFNRDVQITDKSLLSSMLRWIIDKIWLLDCGSKLRPIVDKDTEQWPSAKKLQGQQLMLGVAAPNTGYGGMDRDFLFNWKMFCKLKLCYFWALVHSTFCS